MLNPGFQWLDPDTEQLERLTSLSPLPSDHVEWQAILKNAAPDVLAPVVNRVAVQMASPGIHPSREIITALRNAARELGVDTPEPQWYGWPHALLEGFFSRLSEPGIILLGVLDGEGIWAGCLGGVSRGGLDWLTTFNLLWMDEPELASRQSIKDLPELCQAASSRFNRPAGGLFIYRDEFKAWRDRGWAMDLLRHFVHQQTAVEHWSGDVNIA
jgi:hypothetical protein